MPVSALKPCTYPGCTELVKGSRCAQHMRKAAQLWHDPVVQRLYKTARWLRIRSAQLGYQPWCEDCMSKGIYEPATDVDHITPHRGDRVKFFEGPFQSLCHPCHSRKTAAEVLNQ